MEVTTQWHSEKEQVTFSTRHVTALWQQLSSEIDVPPNQQR
jgi:hypothetical protein